MWYIRNRVVTSYYVDNYINVTSTYPSVTTYVVVYITECVGMSDV